MEINNSMRFLFDLNRSQQHVETAVEQLSSGKRINSAEDDAAGLSISTSMTSKIEGLRQTVRNTNDAVALAQSAEGALGEVTNILQKMRTLLVQAINDTNSRSDRQALNEKFVLLKSEINRIIDTTVFNDTSLLKEGYTGSLNVGIGTTETIDLRLNDSSTSNLGAYTTHASTSPTMVTINGGYSASMDLSSLDGSNGFRLDPPDTGVYPKSTHPLRRVDKTALNSCS